VNSVKKTAIKKNHVFEDIVRGIKPTENQQIYKEKLNNEATTMIVVTGTAGTGKTMFACQKAVEYLKNTNKKIILTRPLVSVEEEELGFLPGNIDKKMQPWTTPLFDYLLEHMTKDRIQLLTKENRLEVCPLAYMRGRTFNNAFIIADEMQNSSPSQMKMLVTRIGKESRIVITGDLEQSDLNCINGLKDLIEKMNKINFDEEIARIELKSNDVCRSSLVKKMNNLYLM
jgi:phosphate starvation-inducible PhoH-like protein